MQHLTLPQLLGLGIFASYFGLILALLVVIFRSLPPPHNPNVSKGRVYSFIALTLISFAHTWFCESASRISTTIMLIYTRYVFIHARKFLSFKVNVRLLRDHFAQWSFVDYEKSHVVHYEQTQMERVANWLSGTALFEQAWKIVCSHPQNWWWSEQLCLFTVGAWTVFLLSEGKVP